MSKLETVKALNDSEPQLQVVAAVRDVQQLMSSMQVDLSNLLSNLPQSVTAVRDLEQLTSSMQSDLSSLPQIMSSMQSDLSSLPTAIAGELSSLATLAESLDKALSAQRQTLDTLSRDATASLEQRLTEIMEAQRRDAAQLRQTLAGLQASVRAIERASKLPKQIEDATATMKDAAADLTRSRTWLLITAIVASAVLSAALTAAALTWAGTLGSNKPAQQSAAQAQDNRGAWQRLNELTRGK